jgi:hypothetical protein
VDEDGLVTAIAPGTATITVTTVDGDFTDEVVVTVPDPKAGYYGTWTVSGSISTTVTIDAESFSITRSGLLTIANLNMEDPAWATIEDDFPEGFTKGYTVSGTMKGSIVVTPIDQEVAIRIYLNDTGDILHVDASDLGGAAWKWELSK